MAADKHPLFQWNTLARVARLGSSLLFVLLGVVSSALAQTTAFEQEVKGYVVQEDGSRTLTNEAVSGQLVEFVISARNPFAIPLRPGTAVVIGPLPFGARLEPGSVTRNKDFILEYSADGIHFAKRPTSKVRALRWTSRTQIPAKARYSLRYLVLMGTVNLPYAAPGLPNTKQVNVQQRTSQQTPQQTPQPTNFSFTPLHSSMLHYNSSVISTRAADASLYIFCAENSPIVEVDTKKYLGLRWHHTRVTYQVDRKPARPVQSWTITENSSAARSPFILGGYTLFNMLGASHISFEIAGYDDKVYKMRFLLTGLRSALGKLPCAAGY